MKNTFTLLFILLLTIHSDAFSQCVPDSTISSLYSPDENEGLPGGSVYLNYEAVITLNVPEDSTYGGFQVTIDSLVLNNVDGLPPGFDYDCFPPSCGFPAGEYGCIRVFGYTNDNANAKTWDIEAEFDFYIRQPAIQLPYSLSDYSIVLDSVAVGIESVDQKDLSFKVEPNPITERSNFIFELPASGMYALNIYSLLGNNVVSIQTHGEKGQHQLSLSDFSKESGVYFVSLKQGTYARSMRFIVQ